MFLSFINYSTLTTGQRIQATLMKTIVENVHTVREEEATWSGQLPCAFFKSLPSGIPLPQPIIMMQYTLYVADSLAANETHTLWFLIFVKSTGGSVAVYVVDS